jgi:hypothetical protein
VDYAVKWINWACDCGNMPVSVEVGTTSDGYLAVRWWCPKCNAWVWVKVSFETLIARLPSPPALLPAPAFNEEDVDILGAMHITLPTEESE